MGGLQVAVLVFLLASALGGLFVKPLPEPFKGCWNLLDCALVAGLLWYAGFFGR